jgi:hypothetical protein
MGSHNNYHDPMQEAADEAAGLEGKGGKHNCKTGEVLLDGAASGPTVRIVFFMDEATHGWIQFTDDQRGVLHSDPRRFSEVKPDPDEQVPEAYKPNTSCLGILESTGQLVTYQGASWSVRRAFIAKLLKPYVRARKLGILPVVTLSFKEGQRDDHGNYLPDFEIVDWVPRAKYAMVLGEVAPPAIAAPAAAPVIAAPPTASAPAAPLPRPSPLMVVTSGRQTAPADTADTPTARAKSEAPAAAKPPTTIAVDDEDDAYGARGPDPDEIDFGP